MILRTLGHLSCCPVGALNLGVSLHPLDKGCVCVVWVGAAHEYQMHRDDSLHLTRYLLENMQN